MCIRALTIFNSTGEVYLFSAFLRFCRTPNWVASLSKSWTRAKGGYKWPQFLALGVLGIFRSNEVCDDAHAGAGVGVGVKVVDVGLLAIPVAAGPYKLSNTA